METVITALARWMVVLALMATCWPFSRAHASVPKVVPWRAPAVVSFERALYTARFEWMKGGGYRFEVGTRKYSKRDAGKSRFVAFITRDGERVATCERQIQGETVFNTHALLMRCSGAMFDPASGWVRFEFGPHPAVPHLMVWNKPRAAGQYVLLQGEEPGGPKEKRAITPAG